MKANRAYELLVRRGEYVEVVEIATGEVVLFWDTLPAMWVDGRVLEGERAIPA